MVDCLVHVDGGRSRPFPVRSPSTYRAYLSDPAGVQEQPFLDGVDINDPQWPGMSLHRHERAHLRGRHHLMVAVAEALAAALPWLPLMRRSPFLVRALVEVSADSIAARSHGAEAVRTALLGMLAGLPVTHVLEGHALGMAHDCIALRLTVLSSVRLEHGRLRRALHSGVAGAIALLLPALASAALLAAATVAFCPALG